MPFAELGQAQPQGWSEWLRRFSPEYSLPPAGSMPQYPGIRQSVPPGPMEFFFTHQPAWESAIKVPPMKAWPGVIPGPPAQTPEDRLVEFATMMSGPVFGLAARPAGVLPEPPWAQYSPLGRGKYLQVFGPAPTQPGKAPPSWSLESWRRVPHRQELMWYEQYHDESGAGVWIEKEQEGSFRLLNPYTNETYARLPSFPAARHAALAYRALAPTGGPPIPPQFQSTSLLEGDLLTKPTLREQAAKLLQSERGALGPKKPGYYDSLRGRWVTPASGYDPLTGRRVTPKASEPTQQKVDPLLGRRPREEQVPSTPPSPASPQTPRSPAESPLSAPEEQELRRLRTQWDDPATTKQQKDQVYLRLRKLLQKEALGGQPSPTPGALHDPLAGLTPEDAARVSQAYASGQPLSPSNPFAAVEFSPSSDPVPAFPSAFEQQSGLAGAFGPVGEGAGSLPQEVSPPSTIAQQPELSRVWQAWRRGGSTYPLLGSFTPEEIEAGLATHLRIREQARLTTPVSQPLLRADLTDALLKSHPELDWTVVFRGLEPEVAAIFGQGKR